MKRSLLALAAAVGLLSTGTPAQAVPLVRVCEQPVEIDFVPNVVAGLNGTYKLTRIPVDCTDYGTTSLLGTPWNDPNATVTLDGGYHGTCAELYLYGDLNGVLTGGTLFTGTTLGGSTYVARHDVMSVRPVDGSYCPLNGVVGVWIRTYNL